jgi:hypothetical protein
MPESPREQNHPLHATDRLVIDGLLATETPLDPHLVDAARLLHRYDGFPGASDLRDDLERVLRLWRLDRSTLQQRTRYRPGQAAAAEAVGSGFDASGEESL